MILFEYKQGDVWVHHTLDEVPNTKNLTIHAHTGCELYCLLQGEGYYTVEGNHYLLTPGTILLMRSGETHLPHIHPTGAYERIAVHFPAEYLAQEDPSLTALFDDRPLGVDNCYLPEAADLDYLRSTLLRLCAPSTAVSESRIRAYLIPVLYELAGRRGQNAADPPPARPRDPLVIDIIDYINTHLTGSPAVSSSASPTSIRSSAPRRAPPSGIMSWSSACSSPAPFSTAASPPQGQRHAAAFPTIPPSSASTAAASASLPRRTRETTATIQYEIITSGGQS